jgi:hypothetical protein
MPTIDLDTNPSEGAASASPAHPLDIIAAEAGPDTEAGRVAHLLSSLAGLPPGDVAEWLEGVYRQIGTSVATA